jgi:SAM-dependent methyltransferase
VASTGARWPERGRGLGLYGGATTVKIAEVATWEEYWMPFEELKARQSTMWGSGPYEPVVGITTEVHEALVALLAPQAGERWLDVATGTGAVALRAAAAGADVAGLDLAPDLVERAKQKADAAGLEIDFVAGDAEALPYEDASFDVVCSAIGTQFAPDHAAVARELARVCRPGGRLGLACWGPTSGVADMFAVMRPFMPPPPDGAGNVFAWGDADYARGLLGDDFELDFEERDTTLHQPSGEAMWQLMRDNYGPTKVLAESLDDDRREELHRNWVDFFEGLRQDGEIVQSRTYLLISGRRR